MSLRITRADGVLVLIAACVLLALATVGPLLIGDGAAVMLPVVSTALVLVVLFEVYRRLSEQVHAARLHLDDQRHRDFRQVESLLSLFFTLNPRRPLPATRDWAASPDLLRQIAEIVLRERPALVLEAGSGVSTLVIAYCLKQLGAGAVVSLEHDAKYAGRTRSLLAFHGLENFATIVHAPLKSHTRNGKEWLWYDTDALAIDRPIDLLVVDGPPGRTQPLARYPALPVLRPHLSGRATIILDDGHRDDEAKIAALWQQEFDDLAVEFLDLEKGAFVMHRTARAGA